MPAALERKLKRQVAGKKISEERKDAYVYGTLRKTGWKPKREREKKMNDPSGSIKFAELPNVGSSLERLKGIVAGGRNPLIRNEVAERHFRKTKLFNVTKPWDRKPYYGGFGGSKPYEASGMGPKLFMNTSKLVRLAAINSGLDSIIEFAYDDENRHPLLKTGAAAGAGVGGTLLHQAIMRSGGYRANLGTLRRGGQDLLGQATGNVAKGAGEVGGVVGSALRKVWKPIAGVAKRFLESNEKPIRMDDTTILEPWEGSSFKSKIAEEQFPSGLSPAAALRLPFPQLMALLQKKNILQQVFSEKLDKLIELNGKLDKITFEQRPENNLRRGLGIGLIGGGPIGAATGAFDASRYERAGQVYKKRDVLGHAVPGVLAGAGVQGGLTAGLYGTRVGQKVLSRVGPIGASVGAGIAGIGSQVLTQRALAGHTLRKRLREQGQ